MVPSLSLGVKVSLVSISSSSAPGIQAMTFPTEITQPWPGQKRPQLNKTHFFFFLKKNEVFVYRKILN